MMYLDCGRIVPSSAGKPPPTPNGLTGHFPPLCSHLLTQQNHCSHSASINTALAHIYVLQSSLVCSLPAFWVFSILFTSSATFHSNICRSKQWHFALDTTNTILALPRALVTALRIWSQTAGHPHEQACAGDLTSHLLPQCYLSKIQGKHPHHQHPRHLLIIFSGSLQGFGVLFRRRIKPVIIWLIFNTWWTTKRSKERWF